MSFSRRQFLVRSAGAAAFSAVPFASPSAAVEAEAPGASGAGGAVRATAAPESPTGQPMPQLNEDLPQAPEERVGFAVVGLGHYALNYIVPNLANTQHARLTALVSGNAAKARRVADAYGIGAGHVYSYDTFDQIADDEAVDVVYIILPNVFHRAWTERAFAAGKHVLCEKPMAGTVEDCEAMIAAGEEANRRLMIAYRAQHDPYNLRAIDLVRGGAVGAPRIVMADHGRILDLSRTRDQWRAKKEIALGGSLYDIGIYSVNGARYLLGEEPVEVGAHYLPSSENPQITVEEGIEWRMRFPSGTEALCSSSYRVAGNKRIHVQGDDGEVTLDPATTYTGRNLYVQTAGETRKIKIDEPNQFASMLDKMAAAVQENRAPRTPGPEGLRDVRIMQAIYEAAETQQSVSL